MIRYYDPINPDNNNLYDKIKVVNLRYIRHILHDDRLKYGIDSMMTSLKVIYIYII